MGRATFDKYNNKITKKFQSTPSVGRATDAGRNTVRQRRYFNPRPPWGGRRLKCLICSLCALFQSTPSVGRATTWSFTPRTGISISIHALRGEGDLIVIDKVAKTINFNPRPPWGGRRKITTATVILINISIHALRGEGDIFSANSLP